MAELVVLHTESSKGWGGQEHRTLKEARGLARHGVRVLFACQPGSRLAERASAEGFDKALAAKAGALTPAQSKRLDAALLPLEQRLLAAMDAGEAAGGDSRGKESAAMLIYADQEWPELDLRVDNHPDPLKELRRLVHESTRRFTTFRTFLATRENPAGFFDRPVMDQKTAASEAAFREM